MQDVHAGSTETCFSGMGRAMVHWLAGSPLRAYHTSRARVQSMGHGSTLCPIDTCQWGMGLLAHAPLTRVIWNTSQSGMLHRSSASTPGTFSVYSTFSKKMVLICIHIWSTDLFCVLDNIVFWMIWKK